MLKHQSCTGIFAKKAVINPLKDNFKTILFHDLNISFLVFFIAKLLVKFVIKLKLSVLLCLLQPY